MTISKCLEKCKNSELTKVFFSSIRDLFLKHSVNPELRNNSQNVNYGRFKKNKLSISLLYFQFVIFYQHEMAGEDDLFSCICRVF